MTFVAHRRNALFGLGAGLGTGLGAGMVLSMLMHDEAAKAAVGSTLEPADAGSLPGTCRGNSQACPAAAIFQDAPDDPGQSGACGMRRTLSALLAYKGKVKQAWDNTDLTGPWLNAMRNSMNTQIWGFKEPNFLCRFGDPRRCAQLALYDQATRDKYQLPQNSPAEMSPATHFIIAPPAPSHDPGISIRPRRPVLVPAKKHRGAAGARRRVLGMPQRDLGARRTAPARSKIPPTICRSMTGSPRNSSNHLIPDVVLTPGAVATPVNLQQAGFAYSR